MQKLGLRQSLSQKLSPQQIQFVKLLEVPTAELMQRVEQELEINPALEEGQQEEENPTETDDLFPEDDRQEKDNLEDKEFNIEDYLRDEDVGGYKMQGDGPGTQDEREWIVADSTSLIENLITQLGYLKLDDTRQAIGMQLVGSIDEDGYIRRELDSIVNDLAFSQNLYVEPEEVEQVLKMVQQFDPPGIAARTLQECLILQLERRLGESFAIETALTIVEDYFDEFTKKHYDRIEKRLELDDHDLFVEAIRVITHLNPKPGESSGSMVTAQTIIPDFIITTNGNKVELAMNNRNAPDLKVSSRYNKMLEDLAQRKKKSPTDQETINFVKDKIDSARWFIDALKQRQNTLYRTMDAIIEYQKEYFLEGDEARLRPMILKDIADMVGMDISTISRVANSKYAQTESGVYPLKYFFSEGIQTEGGEDVSSREVKAYLKELIEKENKSKPLSDDKLEELLSKRGFPIARRTVAKYREQLNIPVARLRREL